MNPTDLARPPRSRRLPSQGVLALFGIALASCAGPGADGAPTELPVLALSGAPTLEIGLVAGDEDYLFQDVASTARLPSGEIVVADAGTSEITLYSADGRFVRRFGGQGGGPGEFGALSRLYPQEGRILAFDIRNRRYSAFDREGAFLGNEEIDVLSQDTLFRADSWLYGRYWVDGAASDARRASVRATLDRIPPPVTPPGLRFVRVAQDGRLWIREEARHGDGTRSWTIVEADGTPSAAIRIPVRFQPQRIFGDEVLGRWIGESDVHFVRAYGLVETDGILQTPSWLTPEASAGTRVVEAEEVDEEEVRATIVSAIKNMASAQEIHYSRNYSYTTDLTSLEHWEEPEGIEVTFMVGDRRGWSAALTHPGFNRVCALAYGFSIPPGWTPGAVICGPPAQPQDER